MMAGSKIEYNSACWEGRHLGCASDRSVSRPQLALISNVVKLAEKCQGQNILHRLKTAIED